MNHQAHLNALKLIAEEATEEEQALPRKRRRRGQKGRRVDRHGKTARTHVQATKVRA